MPKPNHTIEFHGQEGITQSCVNAILRIVQYDTRIKKVILVTYEQRHAYILLTKFCETIDIREGFSSGYSGEGPCGLSMVLRLFQHLEVEIEENEITYRLMEKLNSGRFTQRDFECLLARPASTWHWTEYLLRKEEKSGSLWEQFAPVIPFSILDKRLIPLALSFWENPSHHLMNGYRLLESTVRARAVITSIGAKAFSQAFQGPSAKLYWQGIDAVELEGRVSLFVGAFKTFRNPRAHTVVEKSAEELLSEFLVLNQCFRFEAMAEVRTGGEE